jgi:hypothetical protein
MQLNLRKIDERIQKLQEIRRIATDPEMVTMLFEFVSEERQIEPVVAAKAELVVAAPSVNEPDDDLVNQVLHGIDGQGGMWSRRRTP